MAGANITGSTPPNSTISSPSLALPSAPSNASSNFASAAQSAQQQLEKYEATSARIATAAQAGISPTDLSSLVQAQLAEAKDLHSSTKSLAQIADSDGSSLEQHYVGSVDEFASHLGTASLQTPGLSSNSDANTSNLLDVLGSSGSEYAGDNEVDVNRNDDDTSVDNFLQGERSQDGGAGAVSPNLMNGGAYTSNSNTNAFGTDGTTVTNGGWKQAANGDCSVLAQLEAIGKQDPSALTSHLSKVGTTADGKNDIYNVQLFVAGKWQNVRVDSSLPNDGSGVQSGDKNQMWLPIYEKALAQVSGGYGNTDSSWASNMVTGKTQVWNPSASPAGISAALDSFSSGLPVTLATNNYTDQGNKDSKDSETFWFNSSTGDPAAPNSPGAVQLPLTHELSVQNVTGTSPNRTVTILNPWNSTTPGQGTFDLSEAAVRKLFLQSVTSGGSFSGSAPTNADGAPVGQVTLGASSNTVGYTD